MAFLGKDTIRFAVVGSAAFLVDSAILALLVHAEGWNPFAARLASMSVATLCAWCAHRYWTFPTGRIRSPLHQAFIYGIVQCIGLSINYGVFSALIFAGGFWRAYPVLAVAGGSLAAMAVSYVLSKTIAFAEPRETARSRFVDPS
jgi:putative flippase GtrA